MVLSLVTSPSPTLLTLTRPDTHPHLPSLSFPDMPGSVKSSENIWTCMHKLGILRVPLLRQISSGPAQSPQEQVLIKQPQA